MIVSSSSFRIEGSQRLPENEVHLWQIDLAAVASAQEQWKRVLSEDERARAERFHFSRDRQYYTATRAWLRVILASYVSAEPADLVFQYSEKDKPYLSAQLRSGRSLSRSGRASSRTSSSVIEFNVSHSGDAALLAFDRGRAVGVDVEAIRNDFDHVAIARRFFSDHEQNELAALAPSEKALGFFRCWTRKEAFIKARGSGLSHPLRDFDVSLRVEDENALLATRPDSREAAIWCVREVAAGEGYAAAICVQGNDWQLKV